MYNDYVAEVQEKVAIELAVAVSVADLEVSASGAINLRIEQIAAATGVNASQLTGIVTVEEPTHSPTIPAPLTAASSSRVRDRRLTVVQAPLNDTSCDVAATRLLLDIVFETDDPAERDAFIAKLANLSFGDIANATGTGENATICAPMVISEITRSVNPRPAAPPNTPPLFLDSDQTPLPPETIGALTGIASILTFVGLLFVIANYCNPFKKDGNDEEKQNLTKASRAPVSGYMGSRPGGAAMYRRVV
jgi:hypothetical protein